jgi:primase-polymerase (primpol)-like protein
LSKIDHILKHKAYLNKKIEITSCITVDHNAIKLYLNNNKINHNQYSNTWTLNNTLLNDYWVTKGIRETINNFLDSNENENITYLNL